VQLIARAAKTAFKADGITVQQFNEQAGGQVIFHLHFHILPRFEGVELKPPASGMEKPEVLEAHAKTIAAAIDEI
jgi:histidine triad (HIT) family protein